MRSPFLSALLSFSVFFGSVPGVVFAAQADPSLSVSIDGPSVVVPGSDALFTATITNVGSSAVQHVQASFQNALQLSAMGFPSYVTFSTAASSCAFTQERIVGCTGPYTIESGKSLTFFLQFSVRADAPCIGSFAIVGNVLSLNASYATTPPHRVEVQCLGATSSVHHPLQPPIRRTVDPPLLPPSFPRVSPSLFRDVSPTAWYAPYIEELAGLGVVSGYTDPWGRSKNLFGPQNFVTYAELAKIVTTMVATEFAGTSANVSARGTWAEPYVATAERMGLSVYQTWLNVDAYASRGDVAQTVYEAFGFASWGDSSFRDVPALSQYYDAVSSLWHLHIISGDDRPGRYGGASFRPLDPINRAEVAKIVILASRQITE